MSYTVKKSSGSTLVVLPDRHVDRDTTSVALVGYNATNYGLDHAQNFVHLMEHFANDTAPLNPLKGQLWYDTTTNTMKVYNDTLWVMVSGTPSVDGNAVGGGLAGMYQYTIGSGSTSILLLFGGGHIVAVVAYVDIVQSDLPTTVSINGTSYVCRAIFPFGLQAGVNLADNNGVDDPTDFVFSGRVPLSEQSHFAGGGANDAEISGWGYIDLGANKSVGLMISNGQVVAATASTYVLASDLPASATFYINRNHVDDPVNVAIAGRFPGQDYKQWTLNGQGLPTYDPSQTIHNVALFPGLTFAGPVSGTSSINQTINSLVASSNTANANSLASAVESLHVWVDNNSATAAKVTDINAQFTSQTGTSTIASAVQTILARADDTSATTNAITNLQSQFTNALGQSSFANALNSLSATASATTANTSAITYLSNSITNAVGGTNYSDAMNKLTSSVNTTSANSSAITGITSTFTNQFGGTTLAQAVSNLYASVDSAGNSIVGYSLSLNSNGYITGIQAVNGGANANSFKIISSNFIISDNNLDYIPFQVSNGVVKMHNVEIDTLKVNTAVVPARVIAGNYIYGTHTTSGDYVGDRMPVMSVTIHMPLPGWIEASCTFGLGFGDTNATWGCEISYNGQEDAYCQITGIFPVASGATQSAYYANTAGDYTVAMTWNSYTSTSLRERSLFVKGFPGTL